MKLQDAARGSYQVQIEEEALSWKNIVPKGEQKVTEEAHSNGKQCLSTAKSLR